MSEVIGKELAVALKALAKMAYQSEERPHLNCVCMDGREWIATDGHVLMVLEVSADPTPGPVIVPLKVVNDTVTMAKSDRFLWTIDHEGARFVSSGSIAVAWRKSASAEFPAWRKVLPPGERPHGSPSFHAPLMSRCLDVLTSLGAKSVTMHTSAQPFEPMLIQTHGLPGDFIKSARIVVMPVRV